MEDKHYCALCGEDLEHEQGRMIYISRKDGKYGHMWCIEKYDEQYVLECEISLTRETIEQLEDDCKRVQTDWGRSILINEINDLKSKLKTLELKIRTS